MHSAATSINRIAVFYDGTFFAKVSAYYRHVHPRQSHLSFQGIHEFIRQQICRKQHSPLTLCRVVESHFFRGRFSLSASKTANALEADRYLDQLLMHAGVVSHYYPMNETVVPAVEKGVDVWLSLEAFDLAVNQRFDTMVLFAGDSDFVPLVRKVTSLGILVMLIAFDLHWSDQHGSERCIQTSNRLVNETSWAITLNNEIEGKSSLAKVVVDGLFAKQV